MVPEELLVKFQHQVRNCLRGEFPTTVMNEVVAVSDCE